MFIYRPDYYDLESNYDMPKGLTELIIAKHRNGATGTVNMRFIDKYAKFVPAEQSFDPFSHFATGMPNVIIKQSAMNDEEPTPF